MPETPAVEPLPYRRRVWFFRFLLLLFVALVPLFMFYATGYRVAWLEDGGNIVSVGGIFVSAEANDIAMYINEAPVENMRLFQQAAYIQNLPAGTHRLHVQGDGLHTWVKELPVYPQLVTEVTAFNMPTVPLLRYIPEYTTATGTPVLFALSSTTAPVATSAVTYSNQWIVLPPQTATTTLVANEEFDYIEQLLAATTTNNTLIERIGDEIDRFMFSSATPTVATTAPIELVTRDRLLSFVEDQLAVTWQGSDDDRPFYFCDQEVVADPVSGGATTTVRTCRDTIPLANTSRDTTYFNFFSNAGDKVLLTHADGLYVQEVDDRGWQNAQRIYPHSNIQVVQDGTQIFIVDNDYYFELLTTVAN